MPFPLQSKGTKGDSGDHACLFDADQICDQHSSSSSTGVLTGSGMRLSTMRHGDGGAMDLELCRSLGDRRSVWTGQGTRRREAPTGERDLDYLNPQSLSGYEACCPHIHTCMHMYIHTLNVSKSPMTYRHMQGHRLGCRGPLQQFWGGKLRKTCFRSILQVFFWIAYQNPPRA